MIDPPGHLNASTDSTVELIRTNGLRGDEVYVVERDGVSLENHRLALRARQIHTSDDDGNWFELGEEVQLASDGGLDAIAIRLEPPVDHGYAKICQMVRIAIEHGIYVFNHPEAILGRDEKLSAFSFPDLIPRTIASNDRNKILEFVDSLAGGCMIKPVGGMGGQGVYSFDKGNTNITVAVDYILREGKTLIAQERLANISEGDRRVFVIDGKPYEKMLNRVPASGSHLGNMVAGGLPEVMDIGEKELEIANIVGPKLLEAGILFAGLDVIGGKLTEINITCPTGLRTVRDLANLRPALNILEATEDKLS